MGGKCGRSVSPICRVFAGAAHNTMRMAKKRTRESVAAEAKFYAILSAQGAVSLETGWRGTRDPHKIRCRDGHEVTPRPGNVIQGHAICRTCAGRDSAATEARFRAKLVELGAELLEPKWLGNRHPHQIRCAAGHLGSPHPGNVLQGHGVCRACVGHDPVNGEAKFRARLAEQGVTLLESGWLGAKRAHRALCSAGHDCLPRPSDIGRGLGACRTCAGQDPVLAERAFREKLGLAGATLLESQYLGSHKPHLVRCRVGHRSSPRPTDVAKGSGICRLCSARIWDVFYVVFNPSALRLKFGISSGDPAARLRDHRRDGYTMVERLLVGLPQSAGLEIERAVRAALALTGMKPVQRREYFDVAALATIINIVDNHPIPPVD